MQAAAPKGNGGGVSTVSAGDALEEVGRALAGLEQRVGGFGEVTSAPPPRGGDFSVVLGELLKQMRDLRGEQAAMAAELKSTIEEVKSCSEAMLRSVSRPEPSTAASQEPAVASQQPNGCAQDTMAALRRKWQERDRDAFNEMSTYIFDFDGVLSEVSDPEGRQPSEQLQRLITDKVNETLRRRTKRVFFATKNSSWTRADFVERLAAVGIPLREFLDRPEESILSSGYIAARMLERMGVRRPFVLTSSVALLHELRAVGITDFISTFDEKKQAPDDRYTKAFGKDSIVELMGGHEGADAVLVGQDFNLSCLAIGMAANLIRWGIEDNKHLPLVCCSSICRGVLGSCGTGKPIYSMGNGAMGDAIAQCFDPALPQIFSSFCEKPSEELVKLLQDRMDLPSTVLVGSSVKADVAFAKVAGMRSLLVLTGASGLQDFERQEDPARKSTWTLPSIADI